MTNIEKIKNILKLNPELEENLSSLVDLSICNKTLKFDDNIDGINIKILKKAKVLRYNSNHYRIDQYTLFGYKFYQKYKKIFKVKLTKSFKALSITLKKIESEFTVDNNIQGFSSLRRKIWTYAILETNDKFKSDFINYITSLNIKKDRTEIFYFTEGYGAALPFMEIKTESFYTNSKQLIKWTNGNSYILLNGIQEKVFKDSEFGLECLDFSLKQKVIKIEILIQIITGLYNNLGNIFFKSKLEKLTNNDKYSIAIISGLSNIKFIGKEESELLLDLFENYKTNNSEILVHLPKLLFAILKSSKLRSNSKYFKMCFFHLEELISINNENLIHFILRQLEYEENHKAANQNLILKLTEKSHFKFETYLNSINQFLRVQNNISYFEQIINSLAQNHPLKSISKFLSSTINEFLKIDKVNFDKVLIKLLINDKPNHRFLGNDILSEVSHGSFSFDFNILNLDPIDQYKLWVSICQNYREPKYIIPCLLPLFKSKSSIVKEAFICKMEEYSENYGGFVTEIIESNIDADDTELKEIYTRIEEYRDTYYKNNVLVKQKIKELNPFYSQNKLFTEFNKNHSRIFSRQLQKSTDQHSSFLNFFPKVTLLKGGGWKMDGKKGISKLGNFSSSFSLPKIYFTQPENFDFEMNVTSSKNWDDNSFIEIKNALKNE